MLAKVSQVPFNYLPNLKLGYHKDLSTKSTSNLSNSNFFMFIEKKSSQTNYSDAIWRLLLYLIA